MEELCESNRFQHRPLHQDFQEVRVVQIQHSFNDDDHIELRLKHIVIGGPGDAHIPAWIKRTTPTDLWNRESHNHNFTALSYVWGPAEPKCVAWITDGDQHGWMTIHPNLDNFLKTFRRDPNSAPFTWFWIDQISINQKDDHEKGHQVSLMSEIYTFAAHVEVWLAPVAPIGSEEAIAWISKVPELAGSSWSAPKFKYHDEHADFIMDGLVKHYKVLLAILELPYWSRLWVVQEVSLGHRVKIRLGDMVVLWRPLRAGLRIFVDKMDVFERQLSHRTKPYIQAILDMGEKKWFEALPIQSHLQDTSAPFYQWIDVAGLANGKGCQDVRDKVFGMLGLIQRPLRFDPDYTMGLQEIVLTILRKELSYTVMLGEKRLFARPGFGTLSQIWSVLLQLPDYGDFDPAELRHFLLREAHPALRAIPLEPSSDLASKLRLLNVVWLLTHSIGSGPKWLAGIRLRWMLPDKGSQRLKFGIWRSAGSLQRDRVASNTGQRILARLYPSKHHLRLKYFQGLTLCVVLFNVMFVGWLIGLPIKVALEAMQVWAVQVSSRHWGIQSVFRSVISDQ